MANRQGNLMRHRRQEFAVLLAECAPAPRAQENSAEDLTFRRQGRCGRREQPASRAGAQFWRYHRRARGIRLRRHFERQAKAWVADIRSQVTPRLASPHLARRIEQEQPAGLCLPAGRGDVEYLGRQFADLVVRHSRRRLRGPVKRMQRAHLAYAGAQTFQRRRDRGAEDVEQAHMVLWRAIGGSEIGRNHADALLFVVDGQTDEGIDALVAREVVQVHEQRAVAGGFSSKHLTGPAAAGCHPAVKAAPQPAEVAVAETPGHVQVETVAVFVESDDS